MFKGECQVMIKDGTIMSPTNICLARWLFKPSIDSILGGISLDLVTFFEQEK
jgi:hypothetical protein